jgi:seryl-tRNA synthetase
MLGASAQSATALRQTCKHLLEREQLLRRESSDESLKFLEQEKSELQKRIDSSSDESVRRSLSSAVAAIEEQRRQRGMLRQSADRLDAELTRLSWTLDGMGTQLVRLRSAGQEATSSPNEGVLQSMNQLGEEIDAITQALEQVARDDRQAAATAAGITPVVDVTSGSEGENSPRDRNRERE